MLLVLVPPVYVLLYQAMLSIQSYSELFRAIQSPQKMIMSSNLVIVVLRSGLAPVYTMY